MSYDKPVTFCLQYKQDVGTRTRRSPVAEFYELHCMPQKNGYATGRQYTYNVILRRVHATIVTVEKQHVLYIFCVCVCIHYFDTHRKMHMHHIVICGLSDSTRFFHIIS